MHSYGDPKKLSLPSRNMLKESDLHWFPMRVSHSSLPRLERVLTQLNDHGDVIEAYAPLGFIRVSMTKYDFAPYLLNYVFVRSTFAKLAQLKHETEYFRYLRFVMHPVFDDDTPHREVLIISEKQMDDYKRVTAAENDKIVFLNDLRFACKPGREVQITEGQFAGVIGRVKRIKGLRCVVLPIGEEQAAAVLDVPNSHLRYLTDDEIASLNKDN